MEISAWDIYWLLMLDNFHGGTLFLLSALSTLLLFVGLVMSIDTDLKDLRPAGKKILIAASVGLSLCFFIGLFLPTTKQMAAIIVAPKIINNESVQKIPADLLEILGLSMDAVKKELKDVAKK